MDTATCAHNQMVNSSVPTSWLKEQDGELTSVKDIGGGDFPALSPPNLTFFPS